MQLKKATRRKIPLKIGLAGPSGSGKTYSALLLARGLASGWDKIAVIDTENGSADLYSHLGDYNTLTLDEPYSPERYIEAIKTCEDNGIEVVVIDSISHEWEGKGGILEIHGAMAGNSFTNWSKMTPRHNAFIDKILQTKMHVLATMRSKQDYVLVEKNGKQVPEKVGLKAVTREGVDYEFTLVFDLDIKHNTTASKDRTGLFSGKPDFVISEETGKQLLAWSDSGYSEPVINADQLKHIQTLISVKGVDKAIFKKHLHIESLKELKVSDYEKYSKEFQSRPDKKKVDAPKTEEVTDEDLKGMNI